MTETDRPVNKKSSELSEQERRENDAVMRYLQHKEDDQANSKYQTIGGIALEIVKNAEVKREKLLERKPERPVYRKEPAPVPERKPEPTTTIKLRPRRGGWGKVSRAMLADPRVLGLDNKAFRVYTVLLAFRDGRDGMASPGYKRILELVPKMGMRTLCRKIDELVSAGLVRKTIDARRKPRVSFCVYVDPCELEGEGHDI